MLGAIIGDIVGSRFEYNNIKTKNFELFHSGSHFTDDTVMTCAVANAIIDSNSEYRELENNIIFYLKQYGNVYPGVDYGSQFRQWLKTGTEPFYSFGNGAAMRVSACGFVAKSIEHARVLSYLVTKPTHNHIEGLKGAEATAVCVFLARHKWSKEQIKKYVQLHYYPLTLTVDEIRNNYQYDVTCQGTVPQAIQCFLESNSFEDAIRNAISIGGDSDTIGAITGGIAEAFYGITEEIKNKGLSFLDEQLKDVVKSFYKYLNNNH